MGSVCHQPCRDGGRRAVRAGSPGRADAAGAVRDGRRGAGADVPDPVAGPCPAGPRRGLPAAGRVPVRRAGLCPGLAPSGRGTGRAARGRPDRVRDDPGAAEARPGSAARVVLPAARPGPGRCAVAGAAGLRYRRHDHDSCGQRGEPGLLLQAARRPERRLRLPDVAAPGPGQLRHPHRHRRRVQPGLQRRDHLRPGPAGQPARGHDPARRPELRRRVPGRADRGNQRGLPDPGPRRLRRPRASGPEPLPGRVLAVALRRDPRPGHRRPGHRHHQRRARHRRLPGW